MNTGKCRSCGAGILWVQLKSGKYHPLDTEIIVSDGKQFLYVDEITEFQLLEKDRKGYISHFSTCPEAKDWRKK